MKLHAVCPSCGNDTAYTVLDGIVQCGEYDCMHEWNPYEKKDKPNHGGPRKNSGRKPKGEHKKVRLTVFVHPETAEFLRAQSAPLGETIDKLKRSMKGSP